MENSNNYLKIDWSKLNKPFLQIPSEILTICKYNGKKLNSDHKLIYTYLCTLDNHGKLNDSGLASFDNLMKTFGIGSKGSLTGYIQHLVDVDLLEKSEKVLGARNHYTVKPVDLNLVSYGSKSHVADSNKNKRIKAETTKQQEASKKPSNFMFAKTNREKLAILGDMDKLNKFNSWFARQDNKGVKLGSRDYERFLIECGYIEPQEVVAPQLPPKPFSLKAGETQNDYDHAFDGIEPTFEDVPTSEEEPEEVEPQEVLEVMEQQLVEQDEPKKDEPQEVVEVVTPQVVEHVTPVVCGDKSKLLKCFRPNTDISEIDISGRGIGFFAKPLHNKECDKDTARQYLKVIKAYYWDQYNPDDATIDKILGWLVCEVCGNYTDDRGYCSNPNCSTNALPF